MKIETFPEITGRVIVIGDLHGCYNEALALIKKLSLKAEDRLIFLGDLVDRGPKPRECVELAMNHACVLGNHEEKHLRQRYYPDAKLSPSHLFTRRSLEAKHYAWFESLPMAICIPQHNAIVVHAGMYPGVELAAQDPHHLMHIQHIKPPSLKTHWPSKAPEDYKFWTHYWQGTERVIFGHTVLTKPLVQANAVGIDTGGCFGGNLTAVVLPSWEFVSVPGTDYTNGRKTDPKYLIQDDVRTYS